ncbi:hypothetical protein G1H11_23415 [Phytoactinopolyspora alkaliphila]|uniref:Uncharacterized protein n=1 Tax=Phytoactinopolyspora alkaliphila TaxID=1783498 RepID=A0A6N9YTG9_9ACTN|nr:hypothetical protein [Phytoactinopolyspora alkaliphila]NED98254.1 hypothetical protein [Phytoactinopolyspora alkaliphila]
MSVRRRTRRWIIVVSAAAMGATGAVYALSERATVEGLRYWSDIGFLDDYADELTIVMGRARAHGPDPQRFPRMVDGPGPGIETLHASESSEHGGTVVVLRLRRERTVREFLPSGVPELYEISACYQWVFGRGDERPQRLSECPDVPVIELDPPPVTATLPNGVDDALYEALEPLAGRADEADAGITKTAVAEAVRSAYAQAEREALDIPGVDPDTVLTSDDVLAGDDWVTSVDGAIGVAIGKDKSCVMARVVPGEVRVVRPPRISLEPGEVGCSAAWAAREPEDSLVPGTPRPEDGAP